LARFSRFARAPGKKVRNLLTPRSSCETVCAVNIMSTKNLLLWSAALSAALVSLAAEPKMPDLSKLPPAAERKGVTYAKDIKPIFEKSCFKCHGPEKQKGDLRVDSLEALLKGSEHGKVVVPGKVDKSPLLWAVARLDEDTAMPPEGKADPLTKDQVRLIRAWIEQGAK
jgi:mono/diheme cytochrome c family protein